MRNIVILERRKQRSKRKHKHRKKSPKIRPRKEDFMQFISNILKTKIIYRRLKTRLHIRNSVSESNAVVSDSLQPHGLYSPWNSPGQNTGVGSLSLLQGFFPTQGSNLGLLHCRWILYQLSHQGSLHYVETKLEFIKSAFV